MSGLTLEERVESLERSNRRLKLWVLVVLAVVGGLVCIAATQPVANVVRAQRFELVDAKGKVRIQLGIGGKDGQAPGAGLFDEKGQLRAALAVGADGSPFLSLYDEKGNGRAGLSAVPEGTGLTLYDEKGKGRAGLSLVANGNPLLGLYDEKGKVRAGVTLLADGAPRLDLLDEKGTGRAGLSLHPDGAPSLDLLDEKGTGRATLGVTELKTMATGAVERVPEASLVLFDEAGKVLWRAPTSAPASAWALPMPQSWPVLPLGPGGSSYAGVGGGHWVKEKIDGGKYILLEDGSLWEISSLDRIDTALWLPTESVVVLDNPTGLFPYKLVNTDTKEVVEAKCVGRR